MDANKERLNIMPQKDKKFYCRIEKGCVICGKTIRIIVNDKKVPETVVEVYCSSCHENYWSGYYELIEKGGLKWLH